MKVWVELPFFHSYIQALAVMLCPCLFLTSMEAALSFHINSHCSLCMSSFKNVTLNGWCVIAPWCFHQIQQQCQKYSLNGRLCCTWILNESHGQPFHNPLVVLSNHLLARLGVMNDWTVIVLMAWQGWKNTNENNWIWADVGQWRLLSQFHSDEK